jgi:hypothetical protein
MEWLKIFLNIKFWSSPMKMLRSSLLVFSLITFLLVFIEPGNALTFNDHDYTVITGNYSWEEANSYLPEGYHLATVTSLAEQNFLVNNLLAEYTGEYWLGAFQKPGNAPTEGWQWVTDEPWAFENWAPNEPNDWNGIAEDHLGIWSRYDWQWNDEHGRANINGFIAESAPIPTPEPTTILLLGSGLVGLAGLRKKFKK